MLPFNIFYSTRKSFFSFVVSNNSFSRFACGKIGLRIDITRLIIRFVHTSLQLVCLRKMMCPILCFFSLVLCEILFLTSKKFWLRRSSGKPFSLQMKKKCFIEKIRKIRFISEKHFVHSESPSTRL